MSNRKSPTHLTPDMKVKVGREYAEASRYARRRVAEKYNISRGSAAVYAARWRATRGVVSTPPSTPPSTEPTLPVSKMLEILQDIDSGKTTTDEAILGLTYALKLMGE